MRSGNAATSPASAATTVVGGALRWLVAVAGGAFIALYCGLAIVHLLYPFELEWMEGGSLDHVRRILSGRALYGPPALDFTPFIYPPGYAYLCAGVARVVSATPDALGFAPLRAVSFLSSLGCIGMIFAIVRALSGNRRAALAAAGLFAATYPLSGAWLDVARVDSLFLLLLLAAVHLCLTRRSARSWAAAGLCFALAFMTKQPAVLVAAPIGAVGLAVARRPGIALAGTLVASLAITTWGLDRLHGGWYSYYVLELPARHGIAADMVLGFWVTDIGLRLWIVWIAAPVALVAHARSHGRRQAWILGAAVAGLLGASWASRLHSGGWLNVLMPGHAAVAIVFGRALAAAPPGLADRRRSLALLVALALALIQLVQLAYDPRRWLPTSQHREASGRLVELIAAADGPVLVPTHGYLAVMAGKPGALHAMAYIDIARAADAARIEPLVGELRRAVAERRYGVIILDRAWPDLGIDEHYAADHRVLADLKAPAPMTGAPVRPTLLYRPRAGPE